MSEFRAKVRMRVDIKEFRNQDESFVMFLTRLLNDPDLGVSVTTINQIDCVSLKEYQYECSVHVKVRTPPEFDKVEPKDYCRIHMTDEEFGFLVTNVEILQETN